MACMTDTVVSAETYVGVDVAVVSIVRVNADQGTHDSPMIGPPSESSGQVMVRQYG